MNDELARIWKERPWLNFEVLSQHLSGGTEKITKNLSRCTRSRGRDFNPRPPEYEAGVLTTNFTPTLLLLLHNEDLRSYYIMKSRWRWVGHVIRMGYQEMHTEF
jgi:hypothetical protein